MVVFQASGSSWTRIWGDEDQPEHGGDRVGAGVDDGAETEAEQPRTARSVPTPISARSTPGSPMEIAGVSPERSAWKTK
jgi:hypothetical protein